MKLGSYVETQINECPLVLDLADEGVRSGLDSIAMIRLWMSDLSCSSLSKLLYHSLNIFHERNSTNDGDRASILKGFMADRLVQNAINKHSLRLFQASNISNLNQIKDYIDGGAKPSFCSEFEGVAETMVRSIILFEQSEPNVDALFNEQETLSNLLRGVINKESISAGSLCYQSSSFRFDCRAQAVQQFIQLMILVPSEILKPQSPFRELVDELLRSGGFNNAPVFLRNPAHLESYSNVALAIRNGSFDLAAYISKCTNSKPNMNAIANAIFDSFNENSNLNFDDMVHEASNLTRSLLVDMDAKIKVRSNTDSDIFSSEDERDLLFKEISVGDWALKMNTQLYESLTSGILLGKAESTVNNMPLLQKGKRGTL